VGNTWQFAPSLEWNVSFVSHPVGTSFGFKMLAKKNPCRQYLRWLQSFQILCSRREMCSSHHCTICRDFIWKQCHWGAVVLFL